jgi:hypothetical protein
MNETSSTGHLISGAKAGQEMKEIFALNEDIPADPVNELREINLLDEESLKDPDYKKLTLEDLTKDRLDRARYGVSRRDIWNFGSHFLAIMTHGFRRLRDEETSAERKLVFTRLIEGCIALNEISAMNDIAFYRDPEKSEADRIRWETKWRKATEDFQEVLNEEWMAISGEPPAWTWNRPSVDALRSKLEIPFAYDEKKDYLSDPITLGVPQEDRNEHLRQRAYEGYSEWDLKHFRTYLVWLLAQASIFFASKDSMGYPVVEGRPEFEDHAAYLIEFASDMLYGEAAMCMTRAQEFMRIPEWNANYSKSVTKFTWIIPHLWD